MFHLLTLSERLARGLYVFRTGSFLGGAHLFENRVAVLDLRLNGDLPDPFDADDRLFHDRHGYRRRRRRLAVKPHA